MIVITYQNKKQYKFSVCILYPVCSLHFLPNLHYVPGLQSAFCNERIGFAVFVRASLKSGRNIGARKKKNRETILAAIIDVWTVCWKAPEDKRNDRAMIKQWLLYSNWRRTQMHGLTIWLSLIPFCVVTACVEMNRSGLRGVNISASQFKFHL